MDHIKTGALEIRGFMVLYELVPSLHNGSSLSLNSSCTMLPIKLTACPHYEKCPGNNAGDSLRNLT